MCSAWPACLFCNWGLLFTRASDQAHRSDFDQTNLTSFASGRSEAVFREAAELVSQLGTVIKVSLLMLLPTSFLCQQLGIVTHPDDAVLSASGACLSLKRWRARQTFSCCLQIDLHSSMPMNSQNKYYASAWRRWAIDGATLTVWGKL